MVDYNSFQIRKLKSKKKAYKYSNYLPLLKPQLLKNNIKPKI